MKQTQRKRAAADLLAASSISQGRAGLGAPPNHRRRLAGFLVPDVTGIARLKVADEISFHRESVPE